MKIKSVKVNNRKKSLDIETVKGPLSLPFSRLVVKPSARNPIAKVYVDKELGSRGITYLLASGEEESLHLDAFLDYNRDPDYMRDLALYNLTVEAIELLEKSKLSKQEVIRRLKTSPSQLARLLDTANYRKSFDEMLRLLSVLGYRLEWTVVRDVA